jgi:hypothetical protein
MSDKPKLHRFLGGYKGYLTKQGRVFKQWQSKYFVIERRRLKYYENESLKILSGEVVIDSSIQLYDISEDFEGLKFLFYLIGKTPQGVEDNLFLSASSEKEKQEWIEAITDAVHDGFKQIFQPDLWATDFYPSVDVSVVYRKSNISAENGNIVRPTGTDFPPEVIFKGASPDERYSFVMMDIDPISSVENPSSKFFLHWGIINITGSDIKSGDEVSNLHTDPLHSSTQFCCYTFYC